MDGRDVGFFLINSEWKYGVVFQYFTGKSKVWDWIVVVGT